LIVVIVVAIVGGGASCCCWLLQLLLLIAVVVLVAVVVDANGEVAVEMELSTVVRLTEKVFVVTTATATDNECLPLLSLS